EGASSSRSAASRSLSDGAAGAGDETPLTGAVPAGGHGSPPGTRGRPRRIATDAAASRSPTSGDAAETPTGASAAGADPASRSLSDGATGAGVETPTGASVRVVSSRSARSTTGGVTGAAVIGASPAGGQGSPPGTRGRPRRSVRELVA